MKEWQILVVDDEPGILRSVERILGRRYHVLSIDSSEKGIAFARRHRPDIAIIDIRMPHVDGFELLQMLKDINDDIEVILMTGSVDDSDEKLIKAIREKAYYYITKPFEREVLLALVERCVEKKRLERDNRNYTEQLRRQLVSAYAFQKSMLPPASAALNGYQIRAAYFPCEHVAGDFYDYEACGTDQLSLIIADVVGHGASAAMLTALVKSAFRKSSCVDFDPCKVVTHVAENMSAFTADQFVTLFSARLSRSTGSMEYVNAGHTEGLIVQPGGKVDSLKSTCPCVSPVTADCSWECRTTDFPNDSLLLLYTDGIIEAWHDDVMFGPDRFYELVRTRAAQREDLIASISGGLEAFLQGDPRTDDITLLSAWRSDS